MRATTYFIAPDTFGMADVLLSGRRNRTGVHNCNNICHGSRYNRIRTMENRNTNRRVAVFQYTKLWLKSGKQHCKCSNAGYYRAPRYDGVFTAHYNPALVNFSYQNPYLASMSR